MSDEGYRHARPDFWTVVRRALFRRCPNCGSGRLFTSYLKQVDQCAVCGEAYGHIRSDDAAPWLTVLVVGLVGAPIVAVIESLTDWPNWVSMTVWPLFGLLLALAVLPRTKAVIIAMIWFTRGPGSERD